MLNRKFRDARDEKYSDKNFWYPLCTYQKSLRYPSNANTVFLKKIQHLNFRDITQTSRNPKIFKNANIKYFVMLSCKLQNISFSDIHSWKTLAKSKNYKKKTRFFNAWAFQAAYNVRKNFRRKEVAQKKKTKKLDTALDFFLLKMQNFWNIKNFCSMSILNHTDGACLGRCRLVTSCPKEFDKISNNLVNLKRCNDMRSIL